MKIWSSERGRVIFLSIVLVASLIAGFAFAGSMWAQTHPVESSQIWRSMTTVASIIILIAIFVFLGIGIPFVFFNAMLAQFPPEEQEEVARQVMYASAGSLDPLIAQMASVNYRPIRDKAGERLLAFEPRPKPRLPAS